MTSTTSSRGFWRKPQDRRSASTVKRGTSRTIRATSSSSRERQLVTSIDPTVQLSVTTAQMRRVIFVAALVIAATVRLDAPPGLEGALAIRLLEEGHRVTKVEADVALVVTASAAGYAIALGERHWQIEPGPP